MNAAPSITGCLTVALTVLANGAAAQSAAPDTKAADVIVCQSNGKGPQSTEAACLPRLNGVAVRSGDVLRIILKDGTTKAFKDKCEASKDEPCPFFILKGYYSQNDAVVVERWWNAGPVFFVTTAYMVERASARVIELPDEPHYSPDGSRFVSMAVCADRCANRIDIWSIQDRVAKLEWRHRVKEEKKKTNFYSFVEWQGNEQVNLRIIPEFDEATDRGKGRREEEAVEATLTRAEQRWRFQSPLTR